jgi:hypothetical protein
MKTVSAKDIEYRREYAKQYYIRKQLGEISTAPPQQRRPKKPPYCHYCKTRSLYDLLPAEDGLLQRVCRNCGQGDLYISGTQPPR